LVSNQRQINPIRALPFHFLASISISSSLLDSCLQGGLSFCVFRSKFLFPPSHSLSLSLSLFLSEMPSYNKLYVIGTVEPPLWSSSQSFSLHSQRPRVRFSALPDFLRHSSHSSILPTIHPFIHIHPPTYPHPFINSHIQPPVHPSIHPL
jgi:hypothetical protein